MKTLLNVLAQLEDRFGQSSITLFSYNLIEIRLFESNRTYPISYKDEEDLFNKLKKLTFIK